jgi:hypothetical protein
MRMQCQDIISFLSVHHQKKTFATYSWHTHSRWQFALIPVVSSNDTTYGNVVSVPTENTTKIYIWHTSPLIPQVVSMRLTLHGQHYICCENVLRKRPQDIPRSPRLRCAVMASRTTDTQPLLHDRDYPQANLILRGQEQDSHHPAGRYLPSYRLFGVSLQKSKL